MSIREQLALLAIVATMIALVVTARLLMKPSRFRTLLVWGILGAGGAGILGLAVVTHSETAVPVWNHFHVGNPFALILLGLIPLTAWLSYRSLAPLGEARRVLAVVLRSIVLILLILALARFAWVNWSYDLSVIVAIDLSDSVPIDLRARARSWIEEQLETKPKRDRAGLLYFAAEPHLEVPPVTYLELIDPEATIDRTATDIAAAIRLAQASFPEETARRILLVTDGNETRGDAIRAAAAAGSDGIPIDVYPILYSFQNDVAIDRILVPSNATVGETIRIRVLLKALHEVTGTLRVYARSPAGDTLLAERRVELHRQLPGQREIVHAEDVLFKVDQPSFYRFIAEFSPDDPRQDRSPQNNALSSFTYVRGKAKVLLAGTEADNTNFLAEILQNEGFEVELVTPGAMPSDATELATYDLVVLNNVAAQMSESPEELPQGVSYINNRQMRAIERAVHDAGTGLVVIGGPDSYGAGGYDDTPLEEALPVDMEVPALKVYAKGALVCIFHASEMPQGNYWQKVVAKEAIRVLSPLDEVGVIAWRGVTAWIHPLQPAGDKRLVLSRIDRMFPGDMPDADPGLRLALTALNKSDAANKLIIIISDFDPTPPNPATVQQLRAANIAVTCVAVATHGSLPIDWARRLAADTGGRFYDVKDPRALPRIFFREARTVARSLIFERDPPWKLTVAALTAAVADLDPSALPPIYGYVTTTPKSSELVEVPLVSPVPLPDQPAPILAHWRYGLGKSIAFTSDLGNRWCRLWPQWSGYRQFWTRILRWAIRELDQENLQVHTRVVDDRLVITADAQDRRGNPLNFGDVVARVVTPKLESHEVKLSQVAPGRYEGDLKGLTDMGSYLVTVAAAHPRVGILQAVTGATVPYPREYSFLESNQLVLSSIAAVSGGKLLDPAHPDANLFRRDYEPRRTMRPLWPALLLAAAAVFFVDVLNRKIAFSLKPIQEWYRKRQEAHREIEERVRRLKERKKAVTERWKPVSIDTTRQPTTRPVVVPPPSDKPAPTLTGPQERSTEDLTRRLLEAKRRALSSRRVGQQHEPPDKSKGEE